MAATKTAKPKSDKPKTTRRKSKYVTELCTHCGKVAKLELIGNALGHEDGLQWAKCSKCRHNMLVGTGTKEAAKAAGSVRLAVEDCIPYSPSRVYTVGDSVFHQEWSDIGTVASKEILASGAHAIVVMFEKVGEKRLIENFQN
jgi:hypothetical protein